VNLTLNIMVGGRVRMAVPYDPEQMAETAAALRKQLPALRQLGRVVVWVDEDANNISHLIVGSDAHA
jgi:hypothetical protein